MLIKKKKNSIDVKQSIIIDNLLRKSHTISLIENILEHINSYIVFNVDNEIMVKFYYFSKIKNKWEKIDVKSLKNDKDEFAKIGFKKEIC